jgi:mannose-6-phosphate isomerase-like protein (cupin superfamily)
MNTARLKVLRPDEGSHFSVFGSTMTYKATAEDTGGAFSLALETTPPKGGLPSHVHSREDEAMYILEGEYEIECGDQVFRAGAGTFVFLPRNVANRYQNFGITPAKFLYITSPAGSERVVQETSRLISGGNPDMHRVKDVARDHGIEFT